MLREGTLAIWGWNNLSGQEKPFVRDLYPPSHPPPIFVIKVCKASKFWFNYNLTVFRQERGRGLNKVALNRRGGGAFIMGRTG